MRKTVVASRLVIRCILILGLLLTSLIVNSHERIISATGNASEIIVELGLADKLVAVDTTSTLPAEIMEKKPKIGYRRRLSVEGILSMQPDLLILAPDAGPPTAIEQLKSIDIPILTIGDKKTVKGIIQDIRLLAEKLNAEDKANILIERILSDEQKIKTQIKNYPRQPKIIFLMDGGTGGQQLMALGRNSAGDAMIKLVGGKNVFASEFESLKPVSAEAMINTDMDMIIIATYSQADDSKSAATAKLEQAVSLYPNMEWTVAGQNKCLFRIGIVEALGFGTGFSQVAEQIAKTARSCINLSLK